VKEVIHLMKNAMKLLMPVAAFALLAGTTAAGEKMLVRDGEKTYTVEVISADTTAKTLTIRGDDGQSTLFVDDRAIGSLGTVRPGDTITVATRDEATGRRRYVTAIVNGTVTRQPTAEKTVVIREQGAPVGFVNLDPDTRKITVVDDYGDRKVYRVEDNAMLSVSDLRPGQKVRLSYRFDRDGRPEAVVRVASTPVTRVEGGSTVEVLSTDPVARTLTIRSDGKRRTLYVDDRAALSLRDLRSGDSVVLGLEDDRVVVISRMY